MKNLHYKFALYGKSLTFMLHDAVLAFCFIFLSLYIHLSDLSLELYFSAKFLLFFFMMGVSQIASLYVFGPYKGIWGQSGTFDLSRVLGGVSFAVLASLAVTFFFNRLEGVRRGAFIVNWLFLIVGPVGGCFTYKVLRERIGTKEIERIVKCCGDTGVGFKTLPHIKDILHEKIGFSELRDVEPEKILGRKEAVLDKKSVGGMFTKNRVIVRGVGDSIDS